MKTNLIRLPLALLSLAAVIYLFGGLMGKLHAVEDKNELLMSILCSDKESFSNKLDMAVMPELLNHAEDRKVMWEQLKNNLVAECSSS